MHYELREEVYWANMELHIQKLAIYTWGNASGIDREAGIIAIKPSGLAYEELRPEMIVLVDLEGKVVDGELKPSSDTATHIELYRAFVKVGGVVHTHSPHATAWAQARQPLPCYGTTHADYFHGEVPVTTMLTDAEIDGDYEAETGKAIVKKFREAGLKPEEMPAVLSAGHGPFTWGKNAEEAVCNAVVLEEAARMAMMTEGICRQAEAIPGKLLDKHFLRKHGPGAYYGQGEEHV
ncbi:MAG: L-ribulose-5-phosphate 4-epimerase AraD [Planctomycetes bacterium]|nr:L-ribulose-5-phosphate 4-epimerase AraD [Planctomycetota bacterium]